MNGQMSFTRRRSAAPVELSQVFRNIQVFEEEAPRQRLCDLLAQQAALWEGRDFDDGLLLRGQTLAAAERWATKHDAELTDGQRDYLQSCREARRSAEREAGQCRFLRQLLAGATMIALIALCLMRQAQQRAAGSQQGRLAAEARSAQAESARALAESRSLTLYARESLETDRRLAILLGLEAALRADTDGDFPALLSRTLADALSPRALSTFSGARGPLKSVLWSADGGSVATIGQDHRVVIWDALSGEARFAIEGLSGLVSAAWSADGARLALGGAFGAGIWEGTNGGDWRALPTHASTTQIAWNASGAQLVTSDRDGGATIWDAASGARLRDLTGHTQAIWQASWSADDARIATAGQDGRAIIWAAQSGEMLTALDVADQGRLWQVAWSPEGRRLAAVNALGTAGVWDAASGRKTLTLSAPDATVTRILWSGDGRYLLADGEDKAFVWDAASGALRLVIGAPGISIAHSAWSADGARIATALRDGSAIVWDAASGRQMLRLRGHSAPLTQAAFSPDGARLLTADREGVIIVWDVGSAGRSAMGRLPGLASNAILLRGEEGGADLSFATLAELSAYACRRAGRNLTPAEWAQYVGAEPYRKSCAELP